MDYSAANHALWNIIVQFGLLAGAILLANILRQKLTFIRKSMIPVAVLAGFLLLFAKILGLVTLDQTMMEMLVYHGIALGFIAMSLRVPEERTKGNSDLTGFKSGAIIVSSYLVQGVTGLLITILLAATVMPQLFPASGLLLPMGYGQGPGQANNVGSSYEALGFAGGRSFGLAIAARLAEQNNGTLHLSSEEGKGTRVDLVFRGQKETVPENTVERDVEWRGFRIIGQLDFSLIGILSKITDILARHNIGVFAVSTYNTDYILVKKERFDEALSALNRSGYTIV